MFNQTIHINMMENHLMCPMQCQVHRVTISSTPKTFVKRDTEHSLNTVVRDSFVPDKFLVIPLYIVGVASTFLVRAPSLTEFNGEDVSQIVMTSESLSVSQIPMVRIRG